MTIKIREAITDQDWDHALDIMHVVYAGEAYSTWDRVQATMTRALLEGQGAFLIAVDEADRILGATILLAPGSPMHQVSADGEREFRMLAVAPDARGRGAGEALVKACIERAQANNAQGVVLWTQPTMQAAHRLYERLGFVHTPHRDEMDPRGFMRLVYRLTLLSK